MRREVTRRVRRALWRRNAREFVMSTTSLTLSGKLRRDAGVVGLLFASTTSMVGSGWLFGSYHAAKIAGP